MIISNTEVTSYALCERQHYYRFVKDIEPRYLTKPLTRGIIGHEALEVFYKETQAGSEWDTCKKGMLSVIDGHIKQSIIERPEDFYHMNMLHALRKLLILYADFYTTEPFKILHVEEIFTTPVDQELDITYGLKLDLLVEFTKGEYRGDIAVFDHKFVYNFKTPMEVSLDAQLPKYIKTVKDSGIYLSKGFFNQIRTRDMKNPEHTDLFKRIPLKAKSIKTDKIWEEQKDYARELQVVRARGVAEAKPRRTLSLLVCRSCMFKQLCDTELMGDDTTEMIQTEFKKNTYGYSDLTGDD